MRTHIEAPAWVLYSAMAFIKSVYRIIPLFWIIVIHAFVVGLLESANQAHEIP